MTDHDDKADVVPAGRLARLQPSMRVSVVVASVLAFVVAVTRQPSQQFLYDAYSYWVGALAVVQFDNFFAAGMLTLRGAMSSVIYVPSALVAVASSGQWTSESVLVQNSLLIAVLGAVVLPGLARLFVPVGRWLTIAAAILTAILLGGFAPYPLMDLWAVGFILAGILIAARDRRWWSLATVGLFFGLAVNLRPAYLVPVVLVIVVWVALHKARATWVLVGGAISLIPQLAVNAYFARRFLPWPVTSSDVVAIQSQYSAFVVRYDGIAYHPATTPQLFYCDPAMAGKFLDGAPGGTLELLVGFARTLPDSIAFMAQKVAAALLWTSDTPYGDHPSTSLSVLSIVVVAISAVGIVGLVWFSANNDRSRNLRTASPVAALWFGSVATLAYSTPEARFALPVLLVGVVGCLVVAGSLSNGARVPGSTIVWLVGTIALAAALLVIGSIGLSHPAPPGDVDAASCARR